MDAKSRADFINSVGQNIGMSGQKVCPKCGTIGSGKFCRHCGEKMEDITASTNDLVSTENTEPIIETNQDPNIEDDSKSAISFETKQVSCPVCGTPVSGKFCMKCGTKLEEPLVNQSHENLSEGKKQPFRVLKRRPALKNDNKKNVFNSLFDVNDVIEENSVLAAGMPEWSLEPPGIAVRRRGSKLQ